MAGRSNRKSGEPLRPHGRGFLDICRRVPLSRNNPFGDVARLFLKMYSHVFTAWHVMNPSFSPRFSSVVSSITRDFLDSFVLWLTWAVYNGNGMDSFSVVSHSHFCCHSTFDRGYLVPRVHPGTVTFRFPIGTLACPKREPTKQGGQNLALRHKKGNPRIIHPVSQVICANPITVAHPPAIEADELIPVAILHMNVTALRT